VISLQRNVQNFTAMQFYAERNVQHCSFLNKFRILRILIV